MKKNKISRFSRNRAANRIFIVAIGVVFFLLPFAAYWNSFAAGTISGTAFRDYDGDGVRDTSNPSEPGVAGVTVNAYNAAGALVGTTVSGTNGSYTTPSVTGSVRLEFIIPATACDLDSTGTFPGNSGNIYGTSTRFVSEGATGVNFAVSSPGEYYTGNNPTVGVSLFNAGNPTGGGTAGTNSAFEVFSYNADSDTPTPASRALVNQIGTAWGNAYSPQAGRHFVATVIKRHTGTGPLGASGIYVVDPNTASSGSSFIDLSLVGAAASNTAGTYPYNDGRIASGTNNQVVPFSDIVGANTGTAGTRHRGLPRDVAPWAGSTTFSSYDAAAFEQAGKLSFGGLEISPDGRYLYTVNLYTKSLVGIDLQNPAAPVTPTAAQVTSYAIPDPGCVGGNFRPWAAKYFRGKVYVGGVCDAQTTGVAANLRAYVYEFNTSTNSFNTTPIINGFSLGYTKGKAIQADDTNVSTQWYPWVNNFNTLVQTFTTENTKLVRPQPILSDIDFDDADGSMILAFMDRTGLQVGYRNWGPRDVQPDLGITNSSTTNGAVEVSGGDVLRFYRNPAASCAFVAENGGISNGVSGIGAGNNQGPGGGEFFGAESFNTTTHSETTVGALAVNYGSRAVMATNFDAFNTGSVNSGGVRRFDMADGDLVAGTNGYNLYEPSTRGVTFAKGTGLGDIEMLRQSTPIEVGNRIWRDTNNDGVQDPGENGISGVTVRLYNASNTLIATAVTNASGEYFFSSATGTNTANVIYGLALTPNTNYQIRLDLAANYTGVLNGLLMTTRDQTSQLGFDDGSDSDSSLVTNPTGSPVAGTYPVIAFTTGASGENNHNLDVGFASSATYSIGNRVWFDTDNDGQIDATEVGINGVSVSLFLDANADGTPDTPGTPVGSAQTTSGGGYYRFDSLAANTYVVRLNASNFANAAVLGGYANTTGNNNTDTDSTSIAGQNGENGINPATANLVQSNGILSGSITLGAPGEPVSEADVQASGQGSIDAAANMTVDFGFYRACLGDVIWNDNGAGANNNNGILNGGESPISAVRVQLFDSTNAEILVGPDGRLGTSDDATNGMLTNGSGNYSFCGVAPGQYRVVVTTPGGSSSTPTETDPNLNVNNNDNGFPGSAPFVGRTVSGLVTVLPGSTGTAGNKTVTDSTGITNDPTVDFGFVLPPTAVTLDKFTVTTDGGAVSLNWSTGGEVGNLGFNIYRETNGVRELITPAPIAGSALKTSANLVISGDEYSWVDKDARLGSVYYLEDLDISGNRTTYGPVAPEFKISMDKFERNTALISDLAYVSSSGSQKEFVNETSENTSFDASRQFEIAAQGGVKISINHDGWYRVSAEQLAANGFDVNSNRANWQLFVGGEEVAIRIAADGSIEFYGSGADTLETDKNVYYLVNGQPGAMRLTEIKGGRAGQNPLAAYVSTVERKDRAIYLSSLLNGENENWFGAIINGTAQTVQTLSLNNIQENSTAHLRVRLQGMTNVGHFINVRINDTDLGQVNFNGLENRTFEFDVPSSALVEGANSVKLQSAGASSDFSLVDTVSLSYSRLFRAVNNQIRFSVPAGQTVRVGGFTTGRIAVNEIRDGNVGVRAESPITESNGEFGFELGASGRDREFLAVSTLQSEQPAMVENNAPSTLNATTNRADLVIIAPAIFQTQARRLAEMREAQGLKSQVVLAEDIADEFGYGALTAESVKRFLQNAVSKWDAKPRYAILFGDSSYDQRNYLGQANRNLIPTKLIDTIFMETSGDSWLADFDNDNVEDIAFGRLPAANTAEAEVLVGKLARYDVQPARTEKTVVLPSDRTFESFIQVLQNEIPNNVNAVRIDRSAMTDAEMHNRIITSLNDNPMITAYLGHGSTGIWAASSVFTVTDANALNNSQLGFYMLTTCLNGYSHNAYNDSMAEIALKNPNGGAVVVWASSGTNYPDTQTQVSQAAMRMIFNTQGGQLRIGDIVRLSKQATTDTDVRRNYLLLGDPTVFIK